MPRIAVVSVVFLLASVSAVRAQMPLTPEQQSTMAKQRYEAGMARFRLDEYEPAIAEWKEGFRIKPVPEFLYNIAQAYRLSKQYEQALSFYRKYLSLEPKAANRAEVDRHIATLSKLLEDQKRASTAPPIAPLPTERRPGAPAPTPPSTPASPTARAEAVAATTTAQPRVEPTTTAPTEPPPSPSPTVSPSSSTPASSANLVVAQPPPQKRPITKQPWFWGVIGGAAVVVVAAVVVGVVVGTQDTTRTLPGVSF